MDKQKYLDLYYQMVLIRRLEESGAELYQAGKIGGFMHLYIGQEAVSTGLIAARQPQDRVITAYLSAQYHHLAGRRGKKRAIVAVAHSILVISYHIIQRKKPYRDLGGDYFGKQRPEATAKRLLKRLQNLGYDISRIEQPDILPTAA